MLVLAKQDKWLAEKIGSPDACKLQGFMRQDKADMSHMMCL